MTRIHGDFYEEVSSYPLNGRMRRSGYLKLEARKDDDGTVWVRVVQESDDGKRTEPLMSDNLELL